MTPASPQPPVSPHELGTPSLLISRASLDAWLRVLNSDVDAPRSEEQDTDWPDPFDTEGQILDGLAELLGSPGLGAFVRLACESFDVD